MSGTRGRGQTPPPGGSSGAAGSSASTPAPVVEMPPPYVPPPQPGVAGGILHPSAALRKMRSELQRRRTLVILLFLVVAVAIIDYGPEPPQVRLGEVCKTNIEAKVPFKWTKSSTERIDTIFDGKPLYYRSTPTDVWIRNSVKDLFDAVDLYHAGMSAEEYESAVEAQDLVQPKFARYLYLYLQKFTQAIKNPDDRGTEGDKLKGYLTDTLLHDLSTHWNYLLTADEKAYESKRTKASDFKIIFENELDLIARKNLTPDNYPARTVSKEGWANNWRLHEDLDPELWRELGDGVSAGSIDPEMKEALYEYFTGYHPTGDGPGQKETPIGRKRHLGPTLQLLGFTSPETFARQPIDKQDQPVFPEEHSENDRTVREPPLPNWDEANYYLREYVKQRQGKAVQYVPRKDPSTPLVDENILVRAGTTIGPLEIELLWEHARQVKLHATPVEDLQRIARHTLAALISLLIFLVVLHYAAPTALRELKKIFNLMVVALLVLGTAKVLTYFAPQAPDLLGQLIMATPIVLLGMVATIAFGETVAVVAVASIALLVGYLSGGGFGVECWRFMLPLMFGGWVGMIGVRQTRTQGKYLVAGFMGGLAQGLTALIFELPQQNFGAAWLTGIWKWLYGTGGAGGAMDWMIPSLLQGLVSGMIVAAFLKLIERAFDVLTPLGLLELNDDGHPALKRIATYANGTYAHSKAVGLLSEAAAEAIQADVLLVRVGVSYHDLGKTARPDEYIENNPAAGVLHDNRDPMQSAQIIIAHVHDGIQMARMYRLPQRVIDFIPQHHGNDLVKYFYHKARRQAQERGEDPDSIAESAFRYPGPKPRSREAGIVMMADTIDAASRTLTDPTPEKLRTFTHNLMMDKLGSGQLDECGLTFSDLRLCEDAFLRVLAARYHQRIRYPGQELTEGDNATDATLQMRMSKLGQAATPAMMPVRVGAGAAGQAANPAPVTPLPAPAPARPAAPLPPVPAIPAAPPAEPVVVAEPPPPSDPHAATTDEAAPAGAPPPVAPVRIIPTPRSSDSGSSSLRPSIGRSPKGGAEGGSGPGESGAIPSPRRRPR
ncbi:MAG: HDIG domain-containing metalloprotein [Planctomycetota bacterium]